MSKSRAYKEQESKRQEVNEPMVAYTKCKINSGITIGERDDIGGAISGEELLNRLRPRIKALFK
ncbi:hypothetical protein AAE250_20270 [Bacteroides sp. GD17]|jgi:hypothetical protein|uniref:hypothetical protein n=1 Tax=Bacteroides sp. GD17 TaxID=3139826 RepID=UPI0025CE6B8C|nr:hypothetical protein [uncultured Bacteroides sp.]